MVLPFQPDGKERGERAPRGMFVVGLFLGCGLFGDLLSLSNLVPFVFVHTAVQHSH